MSNFPRNATTAFTTTVSSGQTYQLPETRGRIGLIIKNGAGITNLVFGGEASATFGYPMDVNEILKWDHPVSTPKAYLSFFATANTTLSFVVTTESE